LGGLPISSSIIKRNAKRSSLATFLVRFGYYRNLAANGKRFARYSLELVNMTNDAIEVVKIRVTPDGRVSRNDAAAFLGKTPKTMAEYHRLGIGPQSIMVGGRRFYHLAELQDYASGAKSVRPEAA
jgi:hypothetical protein